MRLVRHFRETSSCSATNIFRVPSEYELEAQLDQNQMSVACICPVSLGPFDVDSAIPPAARQITSPGLPLPCLPSSTSSPPGKAGTQYSDGARSSQPTFQANDSSPPKKLKRGTPAVAPGPKISATSRIPLSLPPRLAPYRKAAPTPAAWGDCGVKWMRDNRPRD